MECENEPLPVQRRVTALSIRWVLFIFFYFPPFTQWHLSILCQVKLISAICAPVWQLRNIIIIVSNTHTHFFCLANMLCGAQIPDDMCRSTKPVTSEPCNIQDCPKWVAREWSGVSIYKMYFFVFVCVSYKYCSAKNVNNSRSQGVHMYVNI